MTGRIKFLVVCGEWRTESKDLVFVFVVERVFEAVGVGDSSLKEENGQEEKAGFAIHGGNKCKQDA